MKSTLHIAMAQLETTPDPRANLEKAKVLAGEASRRGAHLLVFPEMYMGLPLPDRSPADIIREDGGRFMEGLKTLSMETKLFITAGGWEPCSDDRLAHNTLYTVSPEGKTVASYRKIHLFNALNVRESDTMMPGDIPPPLLTMAGIKVGFATCYDLRFPELFRYLAVQGAELIIVPSAWYQGPVKEDHWITLLRARAIENTLYVAGCNLVGPSFCGRSGLYDPFGIQLSGAGEVEALIMGQIDIDRIHAVREKLPSLANRRSAMDTFHLAPPKA
jgi:deaminated glutathione amidase